MIQLRCSVHFGGIRSRLPAVLTPDRQRVCTYSGVKMASTYSFWVEPKGELASALQQEIKYLADAYGGPTFPPHVTLVGGITGNKEHALSLATKLASKLKPYKISFDTPDYGSTYHQCIYMLCLKAQATMDAGKESKAICGQEDSPYMPHLSLLYSDIDEHVRTTAQLFVGNKQYKSPNKDEQMTADFRQRALK